MGGPAVGVARKSKLNKNKRAAVVPVAGVNRKKPNLNPKQKRHQSERVSLWLAWRRAAGLPQVSVRLMVVAVVATAAVRLPQSGRVKQKPNSLKDFAINRVVAQVVVMGSSRLRRPLNGWAVAAGWLPRHHPRKAMPAWGLWSLWLVRWRLYLAKWYETECKGVNV